jgi:hypothetical protein
LVLVDLGGVAAPVPTASVCCQTDPRVAYSTTRWKALAPDASLLFTLSVDCPQGTPVGSIRINGDDVRGNIYGSNWDTARKVCV